MNYRKVTWEGKLNENEEIAVVVVVRQSSTGSIGDSVGK